MVNDWLASPVTRISVRLTKRPGSTDWRHHGARAAAYLARLVMFAFVFGAAPAAAVEIESGTPGLRRFISALWPDAQARGVSSQTFQPAFRSVTVDNTVLALTRRQPESTRPIGRYLAGAISAARIAEGRRKAEEWKATLDAVEKRFGVDRWIILAIWAMETHYGALQPRFDVIRSLTTLAYARFRDDFFREELIAALLMLQQGHVPRQAMLGSWAGAMGQPQFMPSSFLKYAVSHSRKGSANIWTDVPDVFASIANFLCENGWQRDRAWGFEIVVPAGFDYRRSRAPLDEWARAGIRRADEAVLSGPDEHILFFPAGSRGPAFLVADNYSAIKRYNISDHYSLSVAHLADRMRGLELSRRGGRTICRCRATNASAFSAISRGLAIRSAISRVT